MTHLKMIKLDLKTNLSMKMSDRADYLALALFPLEIWIQVTFPQEIWIQVLCLEI